MKCPICSTETPAGADSCLKCGFGLGLGDAAWPETPEIAVPSQADFELASPPAALPPAPGNEQEDIQARTAAPGTVSEALPRAEEPAPKSEEISSQPTRAAELAGQDPGSGEAGTLLADLDPAQPEKTRLWAAFRLGRLDASSVEVVEALIATKATDPSPRIRRRASRALKGTAHQRIIQQHPHLRQRAQSEVVMPEPEEAQPRELGDFQTVRRQGLEVRLTEDTLMITEDRRRLCCVRACRIDGGRYGS